MANPNDDKSVRTTALHRATAGPAAIDRMEPGAVAAGDVAGTGTARQLLAGGVHEGGELPQNCVVKTIWKHCQSSYLITYDLDSV